MTGPFGWLVSRCEVVKRAFDQTYFGLDACMANLMRPGMYEAYHHITVPGRETFDGTASTAASSAVGAGAASSASADSAAKRAPAHVVGTLCENNDWFARVSGGITAHTARSCSEHDYHLAAAARCARLPCAEP